MYSIMYNNDLACAKKFEFKSCMDKELRMLSIAQASSSVPEVYGTFEDGRQHIIFMEHIQGKNLFDLLKERPSKNLINEISKKLFEAVKSLHSTGVIHNDLKLDNIMVVQGRNGVSLKIVDLGMATCVGGSPYSNISSNAILEYPHIDPSLGGGGPCSEATDLYSLRILMYDMQRILQYYRCETNKKFPKRSNSQKVLKISRKDFEERKLNGSTRSRENSRVCAHRIIELE